MLDRMSVIGGSYETRDEAVWSQVPLMKTTGMVFMPPCLRHFL